MKIIPVNALRDNYIWMMVEGRDAWVVDPGETQPVLDFIRQYDCRLQGVLVTHHHGDHTAGIAGLLRHDRKLRVYGSEQSPLDCLTDRLGDGMVLQVGSADFSVVAIPGHTLDHLAYYGLGAVFCGDTLFSAGCGRLFEGTVPMMYASLMKLAALPGGTTVYCGHEYTAANLVFAAAVEPTNRTIGDKIQQIAEASQRGQFCTLPSTLSDEKRINPFLRCGEQAVIRAAEAHAGEILAGPADVFRIIRAWKDHFVSR